MIRAILFDFYGVWTPDVIGEYMNEARQAGPQAETAAAGVVTQYYRGQAGALELANVFGYALQRQDIQASEFILQEANIYPIVTEFMRGLHSHFVKLGVLANLGAVEYNMLTNFNGQTGVFETIASPTSLGLHEPLLSQNVWARTLQLLGEPPHSVLVVSGNPAYLDFAAGLGIATLPFEGYPKLQQALEERLSSDTA